MKKKQRKERKSTRNTRSESCTYRDEQVEKERKMAQQTSFGCFGSQLLLPLATVTTTPSAVYTYIAPPFAIHKIRASCINLCTGVDIPCICRVLESAFVCMRWIEEETSERARGARGAKSSERTKRALMLVFRLLRPTTNHKATRISIDVAISNRVLYCYSTIC